MIERWLMAVRDHPRRPSGQQRHVLTMLALRMDFSRGKGFASSRTLAADASVCLRTVKYATAWARRNGFLVQTKRGHRLGDGSVSASEWQLILKGQETTSQGAPGCALSVLKGQETTSQGAPRETHQASKPSLSKLGVFAIAEVHRLTGKTISQEHAERAVRMKLDGKQPRYPQRYIQKIIGDDPAWWLPTPMPPRFVRPGLEHTQRR